MALGVDTGGGFYALQAKPPSRTAHERNLAFAAHFATGSRGLRLCDGALRRLPAHPPNLCPCGRALPVRCQLSGALRGCALKDAAWRPVSQGVLHMAPPKNDPLCAAVTEAVAPHYNAAPSSL